MTYKNNLLYNSLELPFYWCQTWRSKQREVKQWRVEKVPYGPQRRQYALSISHKEWPESETRKAAIYFHGGAWTFGSPEQFLPAARLFIEAGYQVIMPSHRRLPFHNFAAIYQDLEQLRDQLLVGTEVEVIAGMSAGGQLAASIGWRPEYWSAAGLAQPQKLILCGAVIDFDKMNLALGLRLLAGKPGSPTYKFANPADQFRIARSLPERHLFVHGPEDGTVAFDQLHGFYVSHKDQNPGFEKLWVKNGTHLDSCRWMYREDEVGERVKAFLQK
ncbi:hypothetical protein CEQ90_15230 [Lewinellaceae bacterium SD302]|nr:hypothetical protein CEQ90_15230 [Lewinellaceae bacterium SD302]